MRHLRQTRHGLMTFVPHDRWIGESLLHYGEFSPYETAHLLALVDGSSVALDIGANIGCLTLPLARKARRVWALEPQRLPFQMLCANLALNDIDNVVALQQAAGARAGRVRMPQTTWLEPANSGGVALQDDPAGEPVAVVAVDDLGLARCDLLKADVEGGEIAVLEGARRTIAAHRPILHLEADRHESAPALIALAKSLGYRTLWDVTPMFSPDNFARNPRNAFPGIASINLLCVPLERAAGGPTDGLPEALDGDSFLRLKERAGRR